MEVAQLKDFAKEVGIELAPLRLFGGREFVELNALGLEFDDGFLAGFNGYVAVLAHGLEDNHAEIRVQIVEPIDVGDPILSHLGRCEIGIRFADDPFEDNPALEQSIRLILEKHMDRAWQEIRLLLQRESKK